MSERLIWRPKKGLLTAFVLSVTLGGVGAAANWSVRSTLRDMEELKIDQKRLSQLFGDDNAYIGHMSMAGVAAGNCIRGQGGSGLSHVGFDSTSDELAVAYVPKGNESVDPSSIEVCVKKSTGFDVRVYRVSKKSDDGAYGLEELSASTEDVREKVKDAYQTVAPVYEGAYERLKDVYLGAEEAILR